MSYPLEHSSLEIDAKKIVAYLRELNDPETTAPWRRKELGMRVALRMMKIEKELGQIGEHIDPGWRER